MRYVLRSPSVRAWLVPMLLFAFSDGFILFTDQRWVGEFGWTPEWANAGLYLGSCLLAPLVAFTSNPFFTPGFVRTVARTTPARLRLFASVWVRALSIGICGHALVLLVAILMSVAAGASDGLHWEPFAYALIPIVIFTSLGVTVSAFAPHVIASALLLLFSYILSYNIATGTLQVPTMVGGQNVTMVGLGYSGQALAEFLIIGAFVSVVLIVGGFIVLAALHGVTGAVALVLSLVVAFVLPGVVVPQLPDRFDLSSARATYRCAGSAPEVCVSVGHTRNLALLARSVDAAAAPLRKAGGVALDGVTLREALPGRPPLKGGVLELSTSDLNLADFTSDDYAAALSRPTDCAAYYASTGSARQSRLLTDASRLTDWLRLKPTRQTMTMATARTLYSALRSCNPDS